MSIELTKKETYYVETIVNYETVICHYDCAKYPVCAFKQWTSFEVWLDHVFVPHKGCPVYGLNPGKYIVCVTTEVSEYVRKED